MWRIIAWILHLQPASLRPCNTWLASLLPLRGWWSLLGMVPAALALSSALGRRRASAASLRSIDQEQHPAGGTWGTRLGRSRAAAAAHAVTFSTIPRP